MKTPRRDRRVAPARTAYPRPFRGRRLLVGLSVIALFAPVAVFAGSFLPLGDPDPNPLAGRSFYANPASAAALAARAAQKAGSSGATVFDDDSPGVGRADSHAAVNATVAAFDRLAAVPTATWLTPEHNLLADVTADVTAITDAAARRDELPIFVLYGIPGRDCGHFSAGGLSDAEYPRWVQGIADALMTREAVVIVEPDALSLTAQCGDADRTVAQVRSTVEALAPTRATVYLDAGHSRWIAPAEMAALLLRAGMGQARGFATNVSNDNSSETEQAYADAVSELTHDARYVIDTGRNGRGGTDEWCNPAGQALGTAPAATDDNGAHDADLWIKPPGESDGLCNGGPAAGVWWAPSARELAANAGW